MTSKNGNGRQRKRRKKRAEPLPSTGGSGAESGKEKSIIATGNRDYPTARDVRLIERLSKLPDWEIPEFAMKRIPEELTLIATGKHPDHQDEQGASVRAKVSASRVIATMYGQVQKNHEEPQQHEHRHVHVDVTELIENLEGEQRILDDEEGKPGSE
jgi:hypothetical protein